MASKNVAIERIIVAVQVYDGAIIAEWTMVEWIEEMELMRRDREVTLEYLYRIGIRETDHFSGSNLLGV